MSSTTMHDWKRWSFGGGHDWTDWMPFSKESIVSTRCGPGAYALGMSASHKGGLARLLETDPHAILDVGEAQDINERLTCLRRCASVEGERGHMAGWRLGSMGLLRRLGCAVDDLRLSVCYTPTKDDAYRMEGRILRIYYELFGELPPLNYKFNWSTWEET